MTIESVQLYFESDHRRLEVLFDAFRRFKHSNFVAARECLKQFGMGLRRHILWEEQLLFPVFERVSGTRDGGPTHVMRLEHREILGVIRSIDERVRNEDPDTGELEAALLAALSSHDEKEETILYPMIDSVATASDLDKISRAIALSQEQRNSRCYL